MCQITKKEKEKRRKRKKKKRQKFINQSVSRLDSSS